MSLDKPENLEKRQEQESTQPDLKNQVVEDLDKESEKKLYTKNITRIEGDNLRGGAPGRVNGERTIESTEKAVKTIHEKFHPNTVISFENTLDDSANAEILAAEKKAWADLGVKFIELPVAETELNKLFEEELKSKTLEAFTALDNGGTFVHCTHGLQRARAFTEIWRATRGIDRRKAIQENPNFKSGDHRKCGNDAQEIIKRILENPLEARKELSKEVAPTQENLTDEVLAPKIALIGDSIGNGISSAIASKFPGHEVRAVSGARVAEGTKHKPVNAQLEEIDPQKTPYLVIQGGTNDVGHSDPISIAEKIKNLYKRALSKGFKKVVIVTLTPHKDPTYTTAVDSINAQLRIFAQQGEINLYDLNAEYLKIDPEAKNLNKKGVHFTKKGYDILAELLLKGIKEKLSEESKEKLAEAVGTALAEQEAAVAPLQPETIQPPQSTEHLSEKSKELQKKLEKEIETITEEQRKQDEQKLSQAEIKDIRFNTALLNGNEEKVKEEMTHRLAQYTEKTENGGLRLNYAKFNLSGHNHEMNIGLGDIMPPEYKRIAVVTSGGSIRIGTRGLVNTSRESNRIGYIDEATGGYLSTFTGDTIYVLDPPITDEKELAELLTKEKEARKNGSQSFTEYSAGSGYTGSYEGGTYSPAESNDQLKSDYEQYLEERERIKAKLSPAPISTIPETPQNQEIPKKKKGVKRLAIFSDTDDKSHETTRQQNLEKFQAKLPEWEADMALGCGDYISETARHTNEKYEQVAQSVREEFKKFTTPYALALGNHDKNGNGKTDTMQDLYKDGLTDYEEVNGAYSFSLGKSTFVVFNEGTSTITDTQIEFFEKKSKEAKGAVYMVNHIPPYQFAYGAGLSQSGDQKTKNFEKIREIAKKNLEDNGKPFYIISGDNHLPTVLGNFLSPGGMGARYYGLNGKRLQTLYSAAVVDIEEETGKILAVYFRGADSGFKDPLPDLQSAMTQGTPLPEQATEQMAAATPFESGEIVENLTLKGRAIKGLNKHIEEGKEKKDWNQEKNWNYSNLKIIDPTTGNIFWTYNPSVSEGENIYNFSIAACKHQRMKEYLNIIWGIVEFESQGFDVFCTNSSGATGLGQIKQKYFAEDYLIPWQKSNDFVASALMRNNKASLLNPFINIYATIQKTKASINRYRKEGIDIPRMSKKDQLRYLYLMHHDGSAGAISMLRFIERLKQLGIDTENDKEVLRFMQSGTKEADEAISLLHGGYEFNKKKRVWEYTSTERRARSDPEHFLGPWYKYCEKMAKYAFEGTMARPEQQQPPQSTELATGLPQREKAIAASISSGPKPNFDYNVVLMLGCGNPRENHERAVAAAELALKNHAAFFTSGGATEEYRKIGTTEGNEAFSYIMTNPYYKQKFIEAGIRTGIEDQSWSTNANIENVANHLRTEGFKRILIVTTESGEGTRSTHGTEGAKKLKRALKGAGVEVSFYTPERPNIDKNLESIA